VDFGSERHPRLLASVLADEGIEHELLDAAAARDRWPGLAFDTEVLWHPGAGVIDAETAVNAMVDQAVKHGARLLTGWSLRSLDRTAAGYRLSSTTGETFDAGHVVISAGGWLPGLLGKLGLPAGFLAGLPQITVRQEQAFHFRYRDYDGGAGAVPGGFWPTFIHKREDIQVYGLPGGRDAGFAGQKVAEYNGGRFLRSAAEQTGEVDPANRRRVVDYVRRFLPGLDPEPYAETTCLFTNTPNEDFIIDRVHNLTILSPCSGHGAKFAPLIGRWTADLATGAANVPLRFRTATHAVSGR
jgi:sarcosine oxidase